MIDAIAQAYNQWSASYDIDHNATRDLDATVLRTSGLAIQHANVIEIGCGTGKNTEWLAAHARHVTAMDFSSGMLDRARAHVRSSHVEFVTHDIRQPWPVESSWADIVVGNLVLEHIHALEPVFCEAARVLRTGGLLYVAELHPYRQWRGGQAHFAAADGGETIHVPAFVHTVSDYINAGIAVGLLVSHVDEHVEDHAADGALPRLLSVQFIKDKDRA